eukprot:TRINITY_DN30282_c0_g1_i1.p1 TRINITY_DN30282_c0_g1~~TRINITY_DN30282_c0_g1_i1.p1  ORF type:complete len:104 (+),score=9.39 TRINITY_DN30282_c0_g1_i1:385-696(+)
MESIVMAHIPAKSASPGYYFIVGSNRKMQFLSFHHIVPLTSCLSGLHTPFTISWRGLGQHSGAHLMIHLNCPHTWDPLYDTRSVEFSQISIDCTAGLGVNIFL